ncbi:MAG: response regulator [Acidimicrobiales bacterium]
MTIRVLVVDDQALVRTGFTAILSTEPGIEVVGDAADGAEALERCAALDPDVVLMDIRMPVLDGVEATRRLVEASVGTRPRVLILTTFDDDELVHAALRAGAAGFLLKDALPEDLTRAIRVVHDGDALLAPSVTRRLIDRYTSQPATPPPAGAEAAPPAGPEVAPAAGAEVVVDAAARVAVDRLTDRERDVLVLMARGRSNTEIAGEMYVAETTVKTHVGRIFAKLGARDRVQAVIVAYEAGLLTPGADT